MKCQNCGTQLPDGAKFCLECGEKLGPARQAILPEQEIAEIQKRSQTDEYASKLSEIAEQGIAIERRDVAVLFVDVSGFTPMFAALGLEQVREVMRDVYSVMSGAITRCGGYVDKFIGDEVMAIFGAPLALERPCERAITAVDEIEIGLAAVNFHFKDILQLPLSVHAGVAFGQVEAGKLGDDRKLEYTILGETVNLAKRLTDAAFAKTVLVSSKAKSLAEEAFDFESLGVQQMSGIAKPLEVFRLVGPKPVTGERIGFSELGASMFGRDDEFTALKDSFGKLQECYPEPKPCKPGEAEFRDSSHIFGITGEAGIGKSRLKRELRHHIHELVGRRGARVLTGGSWGIGKTPLYWPIKEQIASALGFDLTASTQVIEEGLSRLENDAALDAEHVPYIYHLFGLKFPGDPLAQLEPKSIKDNLWIAIRKLYERWSVEKPLVLVFEDMHWADGGTVDYLEYLSDFVSDFPVFVLLLYRSGYEPKFGKIERIPFTELEVGPLSDAAENDLLRFYLASGEAEQALIRRLKKYSEGNPLFAEEFLHLLLERGKLTLQDGKMHLTGPVEKMPVPTGLSGVLAERFDRLTRGDKRVAYYGAVIGRSFLYGLLSDVHGRLHGSREVKDAIQTLLSREIVFEMAVEPDLEYIFKHALTREMLVSRLVDSLRRELSRLIATRIEELYVDRLDEFHGTLSEHYEIAGDLGKAARHAAFCAIHEQKQQRNFEALDAFERYDRLCHGLDANPLSPEERAELLEARINVLDVLGRWDDALPLCDELARLDNGKWRAKALNSQAWIESLTGGYNESLDLAKEALHLVRRTQDRKQQSRSISQIAKVHFVRGDYDEALRCYDEALAMHRELGDKRGIATVVVNIGSVYVRRGDYDEALRCYDEALSIHRELGSKRSIAIVLSNIGLVHDSRGDYDEALRCYEEALSIHRELGDKSGIALVVGNIGLVHDRRGDYDEALRCYEEALAIHRELGDKSGIALVVGNIGVVHADRGDYDDAMRYYDEALSIHRELGAKGWIGLILNNIASVHAERGEWLETREAAGEAEQLFRETGDAQYAPETLSILCRCYAAQRDWKAFSSDETEALSVSEQIGNTELTLLCLLNLGKAHVQIAEWHDEPQGEPPPLSRDEAIGKAADYAKQAKELAEAKGMKGYVKKADALLAKIQEIRQAEANGR